MSLQQKLPDFGEYDWGVESVNVGRENHVRVKLGPIMPFEIPADEAVKFACLLLKKAGCKVTINEGVITAIYRKVKVDLQ